MKPKVGTILMLEPTYTETEEKFRCKVVEEKDNVILIDYPTNMLTKRTSFLMEGAQMRASFVEDAKAAFAFQTEVLGRVQGQIPMITLSFPGVDQVIKIQRREFVRVDTPVDMAVEFQGEFSQFVAEDISAGGSAIIINQPVSFKEGDSVNLTIVLPFSNGDIKYIQTNALIVRFWEKDLIKMASIRFEETDDVDKQLIVRFCFDRQLLQRKKGVE
ncbi:flagellar brake protein [Paenisporosarcina quisquiliarum]|uniref:flagellar brake protein n=1 Tax=Paenisporosarcina quisquiliarum TaxID=365346 RepID=UPI003734D22A